MCDSWSTSFVEYLAVFFHLLAFMDAALYTHLSAMDFRPELFAIPWFLTCFAHILPLHKLFYVRFFDFMCQTSVCSTFNYWDCSESQVKRISSVDERKLKEYTFKFICNLFNENWFLYVPTYFCSIFTRFGTFYYYRIHLFHYLSDLQSWNNYGLDL